MPDDWGNPTENDFAFDGSQYSQEDLGGKSDNVNREGWYHLEISDVVTELDTLTKKGQAKSPAVRFDMSVLESVEGQSPAGSRLFHRIYVGSSTDQGTAGPPTEGSVKMGLKFGLGLGLLREIPGTKEGEKGKIVDAETGSTRIGIATWKRAKRLQCVAFVKKEEGDAKYGDQYRIPFSTVYQVDDPRVADTPKNAQALAMIGKTIANASASTKAGSKPAPVSAAGEPVAAGVGTGSIPDDF